MRLREKGESVTSENRLAYMRPTQATLKEARALGNNRRLESSDGDEKTKSMSHITHKSIYVNNKAIGFQCRKIIHKLVD